MFHSVILSKINTVTEACKIFGTDIFIDFNIHVQICSWQEEPSKFNILNLAESTSYFN